MRSVGTVLLAPVSQAGLGGSIGLGWPPAVPGHFAHRLCHKATNNGLSIRGAVQCVRRRKGWPATR